MSLQYKVHLRIDGETTREDLARFKGSADAYTYAANKSNGFSTIADFNYTVTVTGWDGRIWWTFRDGELMT